MWLTVHLFNKTENNLKIYFTEVQCEKVAYFRKNLNYINTLSDKNTAGKDYKNDHNKCKFSNLNSMA